jgi:hypothetical protein
MINEVALKGMLKVVKNMVSPEQIKEAARHFVQMGIDYKNSVPLNPVAGEVQATAIIYEVSGVVYIAIAVFDSTNRVTRFEKVTPLDELTDHLLKQL